ncbi:MAG: PilZ domain-containing protein, partial [Oligoflexia bacterium]|nr:PilZ domain-containing protein [Oligoflexia bacterium]
IKLVQEKSLFQFDFVWRKGLEQWNRIAEIPDFSHDRIRNLVLAETDKQVVDVFARRKHKRVNYECEVVAHDNKSLWKGKCVELSIGGAGIVFENSLLLPGNKIYLHFLPGSLSTPFNVLSEVVSKKYTKGIRSQGTPVIYGVKFINLHRNDHEQIKAVTDAA